MLLANLKEKPNETGNFSEFSNFKKLFLTVKKSRLDKRELELFTRTVFKEGDCIYIHARKLLSTYEP